MYPILVLAVGFPRCATLPARPRLLAVSCLSLQPHFDSIIIPHWSLINRYPLSVHSQLFSKVSLPIGLSEFWESEPIGTCKNINPIHDQGCGYHYLDDRPSKWGFPLTLTKTTWIFNFYCTAVFLKAIQLPWTRWFQKCITLGCQIPRSSF